MTVPDGAPKHIEWGDRMAQELTIIAAEKIILMRLVNARPEEYKQQHVEECFGRFGRALANLDKVRDEVINSENLEEELRDLIYAVYSWSSSQIEPATLINQAQKAHRVLNKIVHVGEPSGG